MPGIIRRYHPYLILMMIGSNNFWNMAGHEYKLSERLANKLKLVKIGWVVYFNYFRKDEIWKVSGSRTGGEPIVHQFENVHNQDIINKRIAQDLDGIIELCRKKNQKLMLMSYPYCRFKRHSAFEQTNKAIAEAVQDHGLSLIDNAAYFCSRYKTPGGGLDRKLRDEMQFDDGHPRPPGYQWLAENIYDTLKKEGILK